MSAHSIRFFSCAFLFFYFSISFFTKIFFFEIYRNIPRPPRCRAAGTARPAAGRQGFFCETFRRKFTPGSLEDRSPGSGAAGPPGRPAAGRLDLAARLRGDHLPFPSKRAAPLICITKIPETKKREGERRSPAGFSSRRLQVTKIFYTLQINYVVIIFVDTVD